jgi:transcriptional regulator with XRE-family HTH domain
MKKTTGQMLRGAPAILELSTTDLANAVNCSRQTIERAERRRFEAPNMRGQTLMALLDAFDQFGVEINGNTITVKPSDLHNEYNETKRRRQKTKPQPQVTPAE